MNNVVRYVIKDGYGATLTAWDSEGRPEWDDDEDAAITYRTRQAALLECGQAQACGIEATVKRIQ